MSYLIELQTPAGVPGYVIADGENREEALAHVPEHWTPPPKTNGSSFLRCIPCTDLPGDSPDGKSAAGIRKHREEPPATDRAAGELTGTNAGGFRIPEWARRVRSPCDVLAGEIDEVLAHRRSGYVLAGSELSARHTCQGDERRSAEHAGPNNGARDKASFQRVHCISLSCGGYRAAATTGPNAHPV